MNFGLLDNTETIIVQASDLSDLMRLMQHRWAGKVVVLGSNRVLFDVATDRDESAKPNERRYQRERDLAWSRVQPEHDLARSRA